MFHFFDRTDADIRNDVIAELKWDPSVTPERINVTAANGIVTLRGTVPHYYEKTTAEKATQRVSGVRAIANEIEVELMGSYQKSDEELAEAALNALKWNYSVPEGIQVVVNKGWITLSGETKWEYERNAAKQAVQQLLGVKGVINKISLKVRVEPREIQNRIEEALRHSTDDDQHRISVDVTGSQVTLSGRVHSFAEIVEAGLAAWSAPGVTMVDNELKLSH